MSKTDEMASRLQKLYNEMSQTNNEEKTTVLPQASSSHKAKEKLVESSPSQVKEKKRGRPKGSKTRKEEVTRVGFEADLSLLEEFDKVATKKNLGRREAFHEALRCFIRNK